MGSDVTSTCRCSWEIPDNSISRNCVGAWRTKCIPLRVYNLKIASRLPISREWLRSERWSENRFRRSEVCPRRKWSGSVFLAPLLVEDAWTLPTYGNSGGLVPEFELTHATHPESEALRGEVFLYIFTEIKKNQKFSFIGAERMYHRNFGSQGRGNPPYTGSGSGSQGNTGTPTTQQEQVGALIRPGNRFNQWISKL